MTTFQWDAKEYARHSSAQASWAKELIGKLAVAGDEALLDLGCGDGKITADLARLLSRGRVVGLDASPAMIELASERFPANRYPNLSFVRQDAAALELEEIFDLVFSNAALHWVRDHRAVLRGVGNVLRPGGRVLLQMGGHGNAAGVFAVVEELTASPRWQGYFDGFVPHYHFYGPKEYEPWLHEAGLRPDRIELIPKDMRHEGCAEFKGWLGTTWFPYTDRLPVELRERFLDEIIASYTAVHPVDADGSTHVRMVRLEVEAARVP